MGLDIKSGANHMPLTPSYVAHKFSNYILKRKEPDPQSNGLLDPNWREFDGNTVNEGLLCAWMVRLDHKVGLIMLPHCVSLVLW